MGLEFLDKAKTIEFPSRRKNDGAWSYANDEKRTVVRLPSTGEVYDRWSPLNAHHYTTSYHWKYVIPAIDGIFKAGFVRNDFRVERISAKTDNGDEFDLSSLVPVGDKKFRAKNILTGEEDDGGFGILRCSGRCSSPYHGLFRFPHSCSVVDNLSGGNGRSLLVLGDSQMIPSISVLCCLYKRVFYVDNRSRSNVVDRIGTEFDDILIEAWDHQYDYYRNFMLRHGKANS